MLTFKYLYFQYKIIVNKFYGDIETITRLFEWSEIEQTDPLLLIPQIEQQVRIAYYLTDDDQVKVHYLGDLQTNDKQPMYIVD